MDKPTNGRLRRTVSPSEKSNHAIETANLADEWGGGLLEQGPAVKSIILMVCHPTPGWR